MVHSIESAQDKSAVGDGLGSVWLVIPAYNESAVLAGVVEALRPFGYSVVVVDDGSAPPVFAMLAHTHAHVVRHAVNLGQGAALQTGIEYALRHSAAYIVTFDADGQHRTDEIGRILQPLLEGRADVTLGTRFGRGGAVVNLPPTKRVALRLAVLFTRLTVGLDVTDTHNGFRGLTSMAASQIHITQNRMAHASQILSQIRSKKLRFLEVPVTIEYTEYSIGKGQRISNLLNILLDFVKGALDS